MSTELPPLPDPRSRYGESNADDPLRTWARTYAIAANAQPVEYTADQMREYARTYAAASSREAVELLRRLRAWDHMDTAADGAFWRREIDAYLQRMNPPPPSTEAG